MAAGCFVLLLCMALPSAAPAQVAYLSWGLGPSRLSEMEWSAEVPCESSQALAKAIRELSTSTPESTFRIKIRVMEELDPASVQAWSAECAHIISVNWSFGNAQLRDSLLQALRGAREKGRHKLKRRAKKQEAQPEHEPEHPTVGHIPLVAGVVPMHHLPHPGAPAGALLPGLPLGLLPRPAQPFLQLPPLSFALQPMHQRSPLEQELLAAMAATDGQWPDPTALPVPTQDSDKESGYDPGVDVDFKDFKEKKRKQ
jgi:hypothetical protein